MFTLSYTDGGAPKAHLLREGETIIGRASTCELVLDTPLVSRQHARIRVSGNKVFLKDAGSKYGTIFHDAPLTAEQELHGGDTFSIARIVFTLESGIQDDLLSEGHKLFDGTGVIVRSIISPGPPTAPRPIATAVTAATSKPELAQAPSPPAPPLTGSSGPALAADRRSGEERRKADVGRKVADRRSGRDRRGGGYLRLLTEIGKTLVTVQPLEQVLARVVDLVFDVLPADRAFLLLRDSLDQPLTPRVMRNRDGSVPTKTTLSRTIVNKVMRDRVAMLAADALYDSRLDAALSVHAMNIRSFMCAPLWNRDEVIGVLYCDNPRSKKFVAGDLEIFAALCNYAAVAIEQARLSQQLLEETRRRERLQRYHSPGVVSRILHGGSEDGAFVTQTRDVSVMFCDIVGFTAICQHAEPQAVGDMLNNFFERMGEVIFEFDGTLDKFVGDAILAVFGAPFDQHDHAARAVGAALAMRRELVHLNADSQDQPIRMRIAINSGSALTGDIGSSKRREFTVLGDVVNTAARMESSVAKPDQIVISQHTRERLGDDFELRPLGSVALRGRDIDLEVFEVIC